MEYRERVAHHEAAHAVMALIVRHGLSHHGMEGSPQDLCAKTRIAARTGNSR